MSPTKTDGSDPDAARSGPPQPRRRRPYQPPVLVEYGSVAKLTSGAGTQNSDAPIAGHKSSCNNC